MSQSVVWQFWIAVLKAKVTVKVRILREYLSWWYILHHLTFCNEARYVSCIIMALSVVRKVGVPIFKIKVTLQPELLKNKTCFHISSTFEPFATKHGFVVHRSSRQTKVFCGKFGLLSSKSSSQKELKSSSSRNIFQTSLTIGGYLPHYSTKLVSWCTF